LKLLELGMAKINQIDLVKEARPFLRDLAKQCDETVHLAIFEDAHVLYLAKEESSQTIRMISYVGKRAPLHCTGLGKVLLANLPLRDRDKIVDKIELFQLTNNTITDKEKLKEELDVIKEKGFALDREENENDVRCIAAPVRDYRDRAVSAISISGPSYRINNENEKHLIEELISTCHKISVRLGFQSNN